MQKRNHTVKCSENIWNNSNMNSRKHETFSVIYSPKDVIYWEINRYKVTLHLNRAFDVFIGICGIVFC